MASGTSTRLWTMRASYLVLATVIIFFHLLPLDTVPRNWAPPDLLMAFTFAWLVRRPEFVPIISVALVGLAADLLFQRPPGLLALLVVFGTEFVRNRTVSISETGFAGEWFTVSLVMTVIMALNRTILALMVVDQAPLSLSLIQLIATIVAYPLVLLITQSLMGVRRASLADADATGARL